MSELNCNCDAFCDEPICPTHGLLDRTVLQSLASIADAYEENGLDEARPEWAAIGKDARDPSKIVLVSGRGGRTLLTLADAFAARKVLQREVRKRHSS